MLFRKRITRSCSYCVYGAKLSEDQVLCTKKGIVPLDTACRKFRYDPCKRVPPRPKAPDFVKYDDEDFSL